MNHLGLELPKNKEKLAEVIEQHAIRAEAGLRVKWTRWLLAHAYLAKGARVFTAFDHHNVRVGVYNFEHTNDGREVLPLQIQKLMADLNRVQGHLQAEDLRPWATAEGQSHMLQRQVAVGQIIADSLTDRISLDQAQTQFVHHFSYLGSCGVRAHVVDDPKLGLKMDYEIIHPREMLPFPAISWDYTKQAGYTRQRLVSLNKIESMWGSQKQKLDDIEWYEKDIGEEVEVNSSSVDFSRVRTTGKTSGGGEPTDETRYIAVKLRETWMFGPGGTCDRYIASSGRVIFYDSEEDPTTRNSVSFCPIGFESFIDIGDFHGAGMYDLTFSANANFEKMVRSLVDNTISSDRYPVTILPQGVINDKIAFRDTGHKMRFVLADLDAKISLSPGGAKNFNPVVVPPINAGQVPGQTAAFLKQVIDGLVPLRDIINSKGRVDSFPGLQFLNEENEKPISHASNAMHRAFSVANRHAMAKATGMLSLSKRPISVKRLSVSMAGAVVDFERGTVSFDQNPLPDLGEVQILTRQTSGKSTALRKGEALDLLRQGPSDPDRFMLLAVEEDLDFAMWMEEEKAAVETITAKILALYGDGQRPGQIIVTPHTERPDLQLRVLNAFMSSMKMANASVQVIDKFIEYRETLMMYMGVVLPEQIPDPIDAAMQRQLGSQDQLSLPQSGPTR